ncbi:MAG: hypothetical protein Q4C47_01975 [Planctomycetia bacterium]|nr:hypothetical protein [Planctomycetia bacterium]
MGRCRSCESVGGGGGVENVTQRKFAGYTEAGGRVVLNGWRVVAAGVVGTLCGMVMESGVAGTGVVAGTTAEPPGVVVVASADGPEDGRALRAPDERNGDGARNPPGGRTPDGWTTERPSGDVPPGISQRSTVAQRPLSTAELCPGGVVSLVAVQTVPRELPDDFPEMELPEPEWPDSEEPERKDLSDSGPVVPKLRPVRRIPWRTASMVPSVPSHRRISLSSLTVSVPPESLRPSGGQRLSLRMIPVEGSGRGTTSR